MDQHEEKENWHQGWRKKVEKIWRGGLKTKEKIETEKGDPS